MEMNKNKISDILITMNSDIKYQTLQTWNDEIVEMRSKLLVAKDRVEDGTDPDDSHVKTIEAKINQLVEAKEKILEDNEMVIDELA